MTRTQKARTSKIDVGQIKQAAAGRWTDILADVAGLPRASLDGRHGPCPKCDGTDRFRALDDFAETGAVLCNQCFNSANGDGLSAIQWATGVDFPAALSKVAEYLGFEGAAAPPPKVDPAEHLEWRPWNDALVALWCREKPPITPGALKAVGARMARYRGNYTVLAFPVWGPKLAAAEPVGWVLINITGGPLVRRTAAGTYEEVHKPKLTYGSEPGILGDVKRLKTAAVTWKIEGVSDMLAMLSRPDLPPDHAVVANSNGAKQRPVKWMCDLVAGQAKTVLVLHDLDLPGQHGALGWDDDRGRHREGWCEGLAGDGRTVRNVVLPGPIAEDHGQDVRDYFLAGGDFDQLRELAGQADAITAVKVRAIEKDDDPHRLARLNLDRYFAETGRVIRYWGGGWWTWDGGKYREMDASVFRKRLIARIKEEFDRQNILAQEEFAQRKEAGQVEAGEKPPYTLKVTSALVTNTIEATGSILGVTFSQSLKLNAWVPTKEARSYVALRNGILDVDAFMAGRPVDEYLRPLSFDWFSKAQLPYDFDPNATCPGWIAFLQQVQECDTKRIALLQEWAGYLLLPNLTKQRFVLLEGEGANGKSSYCAGIEAILGGDANCSHVSLEQFADRFSKTQTLGKLVNISGDAPELDKVAEGVIKQFTGGTPMFFDRKGKPGLNCAPTARLMVACNNRPRISDRSRGVWRRMIPIPWPVAIPDEEQIEGMDAAKWWIELGEVPGMFNWALAGLVRLRTQGKFTISEVVEANKAEYELESNPTKQFLRESLRSAPPSVILRIKVLYKLYRKWTTEAGCHPLGEGMFTKELRREFGLTNADQSRPRSATGRYACYSRIDFQEDAFTFEEMQEAYGHDF